MIQTADAFAKEIHQNRPTVFVADDNSLFRERVLSLLKTDFDIVGTANNGSDLVNEANRLHPDVIVLDITMPVRSGLEAAHALHELGSTARLVFLTLHERAAFVRACIMEGAYAYVTKLRLATDLIPAINQALSGHYFVSPTVRANQDGLSNHQG